VTELIELIYEAAFVPEVWDDVLQQATDISGSASAQVFFMSRHFPPRGTTLPNMRTLFDDFIKGDTWSFCESMSRMCDLQPASFVHVDDYLTPEQIERDPARIMLRQAGIGAHLCTAIPLFTGELAIFVFQKWISDGGFKRGEIRRLDALRPHLARASLIANRLQSERARTTVAALELMGVPAAALRHGGTILAANAPFETLLETLFVARAYGGIAIADQGANALLQAAFKECQFSDRLPLVMSIPVLDSDAEQALHVLHLLPLRRCARDMFAGSDLLLVVHHVDLASGIASDALIMALFDLTPAEARLARCLAAGVSLAAAARNCGISTASARTYLSRIFSKTGTHRQHQLVALIRSAGPLAAEVPQPGGFDRG
jgi:DNA-binding CsgD family transcriptional regulator